MEPAEPAELAGTAGNVPLRTAEPIIERIAVGMLEANCYLVTCPRTRETLVIDPGTEPERILSRLRERQLRVVSIVHTHGHFDHISGTEAVLAGLPAPVPVAASPKDAYLYTREARAFGAPYGYALPERMVAPDVDLSDGDELRTGDVTLRVIETPGHTPGSLSLVSSNLLVLSGDTLFRRGIGRTDLPGGDEDAIYESIVTRLYTLPPAMLVYPGHGDPSTIGEERRGNPFVQADAD